ncbi:MAG: hypothetical protein ABIF77_01200 [bacterium]
MLLGELALLGKLKEIPEVLFLRRSHLDNSVRLDERGARLAWFDPKLEGKINLPHWRILLEYKRAIGRVKLPAGIKLRCHLLLLKHIRARHHFLRRDLTEGLKKLIRRSRAGQRFLLLLKQFSHSLSS